MNVLIIGCGYVGTELARQLRNSPDHCVWTLRRHPTDTNANSLAGDIRYPDRFSLPNDITHVVFSAGLKGGSEPEYASLFESGMDNVLTQLRDHPIERFVFASTTGLYAEQAGGWVDESSPVRPSRLSTRYYHAAEHMLQAAPFPTVVARLAGLYGPDRIGMIRQAWREPAASPSIPDHYVNQIHRDDAAAALAHLLTLPQPLPIYNLADTEPVQRHVLLGWLRSQPAPASVAIEPATNASPGRRAGNKRISCRRLQESGFRHRFPTFREGYGELLHSNSGTSPD